MRLSELGDLGALLAKRGLKLAGVSFVACDRPDGYQVFYGYPLMKKAKRLRCHAKYARLQRLLEICDDPTKPRRARTRSARYAAALGEQLGLIERPVGCSWCRRRRLLERHHWDYSEPLNVTYLCGDCHPIANSMGAAAQSA